MKDVISELITLELQALFSVLRRGKPTPSSGSRQAGDGVGSKSRWRSSSFRTNLGGGSMAQPSLVG